MTETTAQASIPIPFALNVQVWWTGYGERETWIECPECCGTKKVTMTLGNGEQYALDCQACSLGYDPPQGVIKKRERGHKPTPYTPRRVVEVSSKRTTYSEASPEATCFNVVSSDDLYASKEECQAACAEKDRGFYTEEEQRIRNLLVKARREMAWSVHYWRRKVSELRADLAAAEKRFVECKAKKKTHSKEA